MEQRRERPIQERLIQRSYAKIRSRRWATPFDALLDLIKAVYAFSRSALSKSDFFSDPWAQVHPEQFYCERMLAYIFDGDSIPPEMTAAAWRFVCCDKAVYNVPEYFVNWLSEGYKTYKAKCKEQAEERERVTRTQRK